MSKARTANIPSVIDAQQPPDRGVNFVYVAAVVILGFAATFVTSVPLQGIVTGVAVWLINVLVASMSFRMMRSHPSTGRAALLILITMSRLVFVMTAFLLIGTSQRVGSSTIGLGHPDWVSVGIIVFALLLTIDVARTAKQSLARKDAHEQVQE